MITSAQKPNIKPLFPKFTKLPNTKSLEIIRKRNEKLQYLIIQGDLWKSIREDSSTLNLMKKVLNTSKVLRKFKINANGEKYHSAPKALQSRRHVILRLIESFKNHSALASTDFSMGEVDLRIEQFLSALGRRLSCVLAKLRNFSFGSRYYQIGQNVKTGKRGLRSIASLRGITLKFALTYGAHFSLAALGDGIFDFRTLKSLSLEISRKIFSKGVEQNWALQRLAGNLQRFICLENLSLFLNYFNWNSIDGFKDLFEGISQMASLQGVCLSFYQATHFDSFCMKSLFENLTKIPVLKRLDLSFYTCPKITNEGIEFLCKGLLQLKHLVYLRLDPSNCPKIDKKGLKMLGNTLKSIKSLEEVHLVFECCDSINIGDVELLVEKLKDIPISLKIIFRRGKNTGRKVFIENEKNQGHGDIIVGI